MAVIMHTFRECRLVCHNPRRDLAKVPAHTH